MLFRSPRGVIDKLTVGLHGSVQTGPAPGQAGLPGPAFSRIAVSPDGKYVAAITQSGGAVYYGPLTPTGKLTEWPEGGGYTSISWDTQDNLWISGPPQQVWRLQLNGVGTALSLQSVSQDTLDDFQIAPDGVRYAIIVTPPGGHGAELQIGALTYRFGAAVADVPQLAIGTSITNPKTVSWYDADDLIVLSGSRTDPQIWEVPVDNEAPTAVATEPGVQSVTAAGDDNPVVQGLAGGTLALPRPGGSEPPLQSNVGLAPTYPGEPPPAPAHPLPAPADPLPAPADPLPAPASPLPARAGPLPVPAGRFLPGLPLRARAGPLSARLTPSSRRNKQRPPGDAAAARVRNPAGRETTRSRA